MKATGIVRRIDDLGGCAERNQKNAENPGG